MPSTYLPQVQVLHSRAQSANASIKHFLRGRARDLMPSRVPLKVGDPMGTMGEEQETAVVALKDDTVFAASSGPHLR